MVRISLADRFWAKVAFAQPNGCWLWTGSRNRDGYGQIKVACRVISVHRWSYERAFGPIPDGMGVLHRRECPNRNCVNPAHLYAGTVKQNAEDCVAVGHRRRPTHCPAGHAYTDANLYRDALDKSHCRTCHREQQIAYMQRKHK